MDFSQNNFTKPNLRSLILLLILSISYARGQGDRNAQQYEVKANQDIFKDTSHKTTDPTSEDVDSDEMDFIAHMGQLKPAVNALKSLKAGERRQVLATLDTVQRKLFQSLERDARSKMSVESGSLFARQQCQDDLAEVLALAATELWAIQMIDSWGKLGSGIFTYNPKFMGDFDTCVDIQTNRTYGPQYCVVRLNIRKLIIPLPARINVQLGVCAPTSCTGQDIRTILNLFLETLKPNISVSVTASNCQATSIPLTDKAIVVIVVCSVFAALMLIGTLFDVLVVKRFWSKMFSPPADEKVAPYNGTIGDSFQVSGSVVDTEKLPLLANRKDEKGEEKYKPGVLGQFFLSFSVATNGAKLMNTTMNPGTISCIHGVRFFSMSWVILGHLFAFGQGQMTHLAQYNEITSKRWSFLAIRNALVSVDSFFALSGLLMMYLVLKEMSRHRPGPGFFGKFYFHRYWRLTPPYMLVLMTYVPLFKYIGDGPFWNQQGLQGKKECEDTWWTNMLYINNFVKDKKMCMGWSWYLANDMQFYIISPLIFIPIYFFGRKGLSVLLTLFCAHVIATACVSDHFDLTINGGKDHWAEYYVKPYTRIGPYFVGMFTGYILYVTECKAKLPKLAVLCGWLLAWAVALACLYGPYEHYKGNKETVAVAAVYNSMHRSGWAMALCWLIFACASGYGGIINSILSWPGLLPLSRLTYCAYLVHPLVLYYYFQTLREPFYLNDTSIVFAFPANMCISFMVAFVASMAFEAPFLGLEKIIMAGMGRLVPSKPAPQRGYTAIEDSTDSFYRPRKDKDNPAYNVVKYSDLRKNSVTSH